MARWRALGDTRPDAGMPLCWVGLVASCVSARACVCAWCVGSAALVGMCAAMRVGPAKCEASWLRDTRDVRCASWACIAGAVLSTATRALYRSIATADWLLSRVLCHTASRRDGCVTAQPCVGLFLRLIARVCASRCAACTRALPPRCSGRVVFRRVCVVGGGGRCWQSMLHSSAQHVSCDRACRSRSVALL
jgi:hypothetical protein